MQSVDCKLIDIGDDGRVVDQRQKRMLCHLGRNHDLRPDILDYTIDVPHNEPETLKECCLVSKARISRTGKRPFADIQFCFTNDPKF